MTEQLAFAEVPVPAKRAKFAAPEPKEIPPSFAEVATIRKGEFMEGMFNLEFPNPSPIIRYRSEGQGIAIYDTMMRTDAELAGFFAALADDVLHYPLVIRAASDAPEHQEHARFAEFARWQIPAHQNVLRRILDAPAYGFSVLEKMFKIVDRGEWRGAVVFADVIDKPQRWFTFDPDRNLRFKTTRDQSPGELVDQKKFAVVTFGSNNTPWGRPVLDDCYFPWRLKHHFIEMHALWMEKWASPQPKVEYEWSRDKKTTEQNIQKAIEVLLSFQRDQGVAYPKGMTPGLIESTRSGSISYENAIGMCTDMEALLVTGQKLAVMAGDHGSYRQSAIHQKQLSNKVEMWAAFASSQFTRQFIRQLIDINYGPQDMYPTAQILARDPLILQAQATVETMQMANGHKLSRSQSEFYSMIVNPKNAEDELIPSTTLKPGQTLPVNPALAEGEEPITPEILLASSVYGEARSAAEKHLAKINSKAEKARGHARPAMKKIVKSMGATIKEKKNLSRVTRASLYKRMKSVSGMHDLGQAFETMLK